jgi:hypothetical protein
MGPARHLGDGGGLAVGILVEWPEPGIAVGLEEALESG